MSNVKNKYFMLNIVDIWKIYVIIISGGEQMKNLKLKFARMEKDISQIDLAKTVGVTRQTIGMIESGDYNPSLKLCIAICKALDKTLDDLFWEDDENEK